MKKFDVTLFVWLLLLLSVFLMRDLWFRVPLAGKFISVAGALIGSFLVQFNYYLRTAGNVFWADSAKDSNLAESDQQLLVEVLKADQHFRRYLGLLGLAFVAYFVSFISVIPKLTHFNILFMWLMGWGLLCLLFDLQVRLHLACVLLKKSGIESKS